MYKKREILRTTKNFDYERREAMWKEMEKNSLLARRFTSINIRSIDLQFQK